MFVRPSHCNLLLCRRCFILLGCLCTPQVKRLARRREIEVHDGMTVTELAGRLKTSHGTSPRCVAVYDVSSMSYTVPLLMTGSVLKVLRDAGERVKGRNPGLKPLSCY